MAHPPIAFLIAKDVRHARATLECDLQWKPGGVSHGRMFYVSPAGERVHIIDEHQLDRVRGHRPGTKVYLGYGYTELLDWDRIRCHLRACRLDLVDVSAPLARQRAEAVGHG